MANVVAAAAAATAAERRIEESTEGRKKTSNVFNAIHRVESDLGGCCYCYCYTHILSVRYVVAALRYSVVVSFLYRTYAHMHRRLRTHTHRRTVGPIRCVRVFERVCRRTACCCVQHRVEHGASKQCMKQASKRPNRIKQYVKAATVWMKNYKWRQLLNHVHLF